jgi:plasmid stabilization system protein ParE
MIYKLELSLKARQELLDAWIWYEDEQPGLGERFIGEIFLKTELIQANPLQYSVKGKYREAKTDKFPFLLVYKIIKKDNLILIASVFHTSRHPKHK